MNSPVAPECVLAVDIGGTKMAAGLVDTAGQVLWSDRVSTPLTGPGDSEVMWSALTDLIAAAPREPKPLAVGVGCGGPMEDRNETVSPLNIAGWRSFPLRRRLSEYTGLVVHVDNDAKALALGEGMWGGAAGCDNYLSMVVSTGVGGGVVVDGRLLDGRTWNAGHIGHVIVNPGGRQCVCGAFGCLEAEASGTAVQAMTGRPAAEAGPDVVERVGRLVGRAVGIVANLLDLELATVAGSVALGFGAPFFEAAQTELSVTACLPYSRSCRVVPSPMGPDGPLKGAAAVAWRRGA
jgi:glucokinase